MRFIKSINTNTKEILLKSFKSLIFRVLGYSLGYFYVLLITRHWKAEGQGYYAIIYMLLLLFTMFGKMGLDASLNKWCGVYNGNNDIKFLKKVYLKGLILIILFSSAASIILFLFKTQLVFYFKDDSLLKGIKLISVLIPFLAVLDYNSSFFRGLKKINFFGVYNQVGKFLFPVLFILLLLFNNDNTILTPIKATFYGIIFLSTASLIHIFLYFFYQKENPHNKIKLKVLSNKTIISTAFPMMIASSILLLMNWIDTVILGGVDTKNNVGVYNICVKLAVSISFIYNAMANITTPKIAEFYSKKQYNKIKQTIRFSNKVNLFISLPIFIILFVFSKYILLFFDDEIATGTTLLRVLLLYQMINVLFGNIAPYMQMTGSQKKLQYYILLALFVNVFSSYLFFTLFGMIGVAFGTILATITWKVLGANYIYKNDGIKIWFRINR